MSVSHVEMAMHGLVSQSLSNHAYLLIGSLCGRTQYNEAGLLKASHIRSNALKKAITFVESKLDLTSQFFTFQQLAIKFGGEWIVKTAEAVFDLYQVSRV